MKHKLLTALQYAIGLAIFLMTFPIALYFEIKKSKGLNKSKRKRFKVHNCMVVRK